MRISQSRLVLLLAAGATMSLGACDHMDRVQQRALSGGALGAAAGVALTAATGGGNLLVGALVGGAGGAAIGAATK